MPQPKMRDRSGRILSMGNKVRIITEESVVRRHCEDDNLWEEFMVERLGSIGHVKQLDKSDRTARITFDDDVEEGVWFPISVLDFPDTPNSEVAADSYALDLNEQLLDDERFKDVTFKFNEGDTIRAHKSVLAAVSPVFAGMFGSPMQENSSGVVELPDVSQVQMRVLLRLAYTGHVNPKDWSPVENNALVSVENNADAEIMPLELLLDVAKHAKKYMVDSVIGFTVEALKARLTESVEDSTTLETIWSAAIAADLTPVRMAALEVAKSSKSLRKRYEDLALCPAVASDLLSIWPANMKKPMNKRIRLK